MNKISHSDLQACAEQIKKEIFPLGNIQHYSLVAPSAYDTAWVGMVEDNAGQMNRPMFPNCLDWILNNQNDEGFWGSCDGHGTPTIDTLNSTLACIVALLKWNIGRPLVDKGISYMERNMERLLAKYINEGQPSPRWFAIIFPGMLKIAQRVGLELVFKPSSKRKISELFHQYHNMLQREKLVDDSVYPLLAYLELLPPAYVANQNIDIRQNLGLDGSLFQSPSATAAAFMLTGNEKCQAYLQSLVKQCPQGVPQTYPLNEDLTKLSLVNLLENFGLAEYFNKEIELVLHQIYKNYKEEEKVDRKSVSSVPENIYKSSLAFRILRIHGYVVSPTKVCQFLKDGGVHDRLKKSKDYPSYVMMSVYRATDLMFNGEYELEDARKFSRKLLEKSQVDEEMIKHEMSIPWIARLEYLDHRMWIEDKDSNALWIGKASFQRLQSPYTKKLALLAKRNFEFRQHVYRRELDELKMWAKECGLGEMGFGREKTAYCYFAIAASTSLPHQSPIRKIVTKISILITVADDFFDMEGSLDESKALTHAVLRWEAKKLKGHSKTIFKALDSLVRETAEICFQQHRTDITDKLQDMWSETFVSWLREAEWSKKGYVPSTDEYLQNAMISIATHVIVLHASYLLYPSSIKDKFRQDQYAYLTRLVMIIPRLLNDLQSYEKEEKDGKINSVLLHMKKNSSVKLVDSISYIEEMIDQKRKEFLQHALMDGFNDLPKPCKELHLSCCKVFEMFFNKKNRFDSNTEMLEDINKAFYEPISYHKVERLPQDRTLTFPLHFQSEKKKHMPIKSRLVLSHYHINKPVHVFELPQHKAPNLAFCKNLSVLPKFRSCVW